MPTRFYFDLLNEHDAISDHEGVEAAHLDQAIEQAVAGIEECRASGELDEAAANWRLVVRDARGTEIKQIPLTDGTAQRGTH